MKTSDIRYIIASVDINSLPQITEKERNKLNNQLQKLIENSDKIDYSIQDAYLKAINACNDYIQDKSKLQQYNNAFMNYLNNLNIYYDNFIVSGSQGSDIRSIYKELKNSALDATDFVKERIFTFYYNRIEMQKNNDFELYEMLANLLIYNNIHIDEFACSVKKFQNIIKTIEKKAKNGSKEGL